MKLNYYYPFLFLLLSAFLLVTPQAISQPVLSSDHHITAVYESFEMDHQGGVVMDLTIEAVTGRDIGVPGFDALTPVSQEDLIAEATGFLDDYPNTTDFFEIVNRGLNAHLRATFPELEQIAANFRIEPRPGVAFTVLSGTRFEDGALREFYGFELPGISTDHQDAGEIDLTVYFEYDQDLEASDIPNVLFVRLNVVSFINNYPNTTDYFEIYAKNMASSVLSGFNTINNVTITFEVPERDDVPFVTFAETSYDRENFTETYGFRATAEDGDYRVALHYINGIEDEAYPNILDVEASFNTFLGELPDEGNFVTELHWFSSELSASLSDVLRGSEFSFRPAGEQEDEPQITYRSVSDGLNLQTGFTVDLAASQNISEAETITMQTGFTLTNPDIDDPLALASSILSDALQLSYEADISLFNYELKAALFNRLTTEVNGTLNAESGTLSTSARWEDTGPLVYSGSSEGELQTGTSVTDPHEHPETITLHQNYPNPFNPATSISFSIENTGHVTLGVYDVLGRRIALLLNEPTQSGKHQISFDARNFSSGVYFYRLETGGQSLTRSMMLVK